MSARTLMSTTATAALARIYDDKGRLMVAICFDMDLGDSWEHADNRSIREVFRHGNPHRRQLRDLRDDALDDPNPGDGSPGPPVNGIKDSIHDATETKQVNYRTAISVHRLPT